MVTVQAEGSNPDGDTYQTFFSNDFCFSFVRPNRLSDIVMLRRSGPNSCCQQNLKCFDMPLLSLCLFS